MSKRHFIALADFVRSTQPDMGVPTSLSTPAAHAQKDGMQAQWTLMRDPRIAQTHIARHCVCGGVRMNPLRRSTDANASQSALADACATFGLCALLAELNRELQAMRAQEHEEETAHA